MVTLLTIFLATSYALFPPSLPHLPSHPPQSTLACLPEKIVSKALKIQLPAVSYTGYSTVVNKLWLLICDPAHDTSSMTSITRLAM